MNIRVVFHLVATMLMVIALAMLACAGVGRFNGDTPEAVRALWLSGVVVFGSAALLFVMTRGSTELSRRDGFGVVTLGWLAAAVAGALPFWLSGVIADPVSAVFETMSGFTTTGASVLSDLESIPRGILFWRSLTHFFGGMGVLVLCVAILPFLGVGGMQLYRAEVAGPSKDRLTPRIATTAKYLWGVYVLLCAAQTGLLMLGGMSLFDAVCHAFGTVATGGFSTRSDSIAAFDSLYIESVTMVFMVISAANFALHYRALTGHPRAYGRSSEFRFYLFVWMLSCLILSLMVWGTVDHTFGAALRSGFFQGTSILTTTGFVTRDYDLWPVPARGVLLLLMFVCGCAGSTCGGIKMVRVLILLKAVVREIRLYRMPRSVVSIKIDGRAIDGTLVATIAMFLFLYLLIFSVATVAMTAFTPDMVTALSSVAATMSTVGPGLGAVGPMTNYAGIPAPGQAILIACMLLGRLELYTVLVLLSPGFWRK